MEKEKEVKTILVSCVCDDCEGEVKYTDGNIILTHPPKFKHHCVSCGKEYIFIRKFPYTKYISV